MKIPLLKKIGWFNRKDESLSKKVQTWVVPASPFNTLKLWLVFFMLGAILTWIVGNFLTHDIRKQLILLGIYSASLCLWMLYKSYSILQIIVESAKRQKKYEKIQK